MWTDKYIGMDYQDDGFDCMDLAVLVAKEQLGIAVDKPFYNANCFSQKHSVDKNIASVCQPIADPIDKQPVLFVGRKQFYHIGVYASGGWILHNDQKLGSVILTKLERMIDHGYEFKGYYRWIATY